MKDVRSLRSAIGALPVCAALLAAVPGPELVAQAPGSWILPSAAFRTGANGAEFQSDVRLLNTGASAVTVTAVFYDQPTGQTLTATPFAVEGRSQASWNNVLQSLFGRTLAQGSYGPIRFLSTGPIVVSSSVNNVNACGSGAVSGQWLPGVDAAEAMRAGTIGHLAVSGSPAAGYRTNVVFVNPGTDVASVNAVVRTGGGALLSSGTVGLLGANGFRQVELDSPTVFPGVAGTTDVNLWLEFTSDRPVLSFASVINNVSGDPFAVLATPGPGANVPATEEITISLPGNVPLVMVRIPAGTFRMGSPESERGRSPDEGPQHEVTIGHDFFMGKYEVTQAQWRAVMGSLPAMGHGAGDSYPVYYVSWNDVAGPGGFLERVNSTLGPERLRLPTEAEWEYAARAGTTTPFSFGDDPSCSLHECGTCELFNRFMWCSGVLTGYGSRPVGEKAANPWGLFDVHGNVWEWVQDCAHSSYAGAPSDGSAWQAPACADRVLRSGHWHGPASACRSANRSGEKADFLRVVNGFRVAGSFD
jgi:formylglycine-generating enzyme required for sulfatase activity